MKWLKKLIGDFSGAAAKEENQPAATPAPAPAPVPAPVPKATTPVPLTAPTSGASIQDFEKAREDFFTALKKDDSVKIESIAAAFPGEAVNWRTNDGTPLQIAQANGSLNAFKALIALGLDKEENYPGGSFPLHMAQEKGQKEFFSYLLETGANIERPYTEKSYTHGMSETHIRTALGTAIKMGDKDAVITLLERGALTTAPYAHAYRIVGIGSGGNAAAPSSAVEYATSEKQFLIADIAKRATVLRSDYLARQAAPATPAHEPEEMQTGDNIGVMSPLRLKKGLNS
jgi:hypothetical protein